MGSPPNYLSSIKDKTGRPRAAPVAKRLKGRVRGLFTAMLTPFDSTGMVDLEALSKLVKFQIAKGTDGLYPCGSTGLGPMLKLEERKAIAEVVVDDTKGKVPVVVQVGCADTQSTVELAKHAEKAGADAVASLTPYYYKPGDQATVKHFEKVASSISIPLLAYNIPQLTGNVLKPGIVADLGKRRVISGVKDSTRDILHLIDLLGAVPQDMVVMNGTEEYALFALMSGADGVVSGGANVFPELFKSMVALHEKGDYRGALAAQRTIQHFKDIVADGPISAYYELLRERGVDCGRPRAPFLPTDKVAGAEQLSRLRSLGLLGRSAR